MHCRHDVLAHLGRRGLRESTKLKLLVGVETHIRREVIICRERSPRKESERNSVHGRERNSVHGSERMNSVHGLKRNE